MPPARDAQGRFVSGGGDGGSFVPSGRGFAEVLDSPTGVVQRDLVRRCLAVTAAAKQLCPVDTGRLRGSIRFRLERDAIGPVGIVGSDVEYAIFVHQGTKYMSGRPFLKDALRVAIV